MHRAQYATLLPKQAIIRYAVSSLLRCSFASIRGAESRAHHQLRGARHMFKVNRPFRIGRLWTVSVRLHTGCVVWILPNRNRNTVVCTAYALARSVQS